MKRSVTLQLDQEVVDHYRSQGRGHLARMAQVLRDGMASSPVVLVTMDDVRRCVQETVDHEIRRRLDD